MRNDTPQKIWLNQPAEARAMTSEWIQQRSRELRAKTLKKLLGAFAGPLVVVVFFAFSVNLFGRVGQMLQPVFGLAFAWSLAGLFVVNRGMWSTATPEGLGIRTGLEFCKREVQRQRDLVRRLLLWSFGPVLVSIGTFVVALAMVGTPDHGIIPNGLPFLAAVVIWIVGYFMIRAREQRELQRALGELDEIEHESRTF
jgi:hypothetical protein